MKVQIEISEDQFKELLEKELKDLPKEDIQNILLESIRSYLYHEDITETEEIKYSYDNSIKEPAKIIRKQNYDKLNALLVREESSWSTRNVSPSKLFTQMLNDCDFSGLQDVVDNMIKDLKDNYHNILIEVMSKRLADSFIHDCRFQTELTDIIARTIDQRENSIKF